MTILVALLILVALVGAFALGNLMIQRRQMDKHDGDVGAALADSDDSLPAAPHITDQDRPVGDTPEAHDEINPRDVPKWDASTRQGAEAQAGGTDGETRGNREGAGEAERATPGG